jgi:uncharacterized membrane protein YfhO
MTKSKRSKHKRERGTISRTPKSRRLDGDLNKYLAGREVYVAIGLIIILAIIVLKDFIFLEKTFLYKDIGSDTINIFYPQMLQLSDNLRNDGIPKWSFYQGMGQNVFGSGGGDIFFTLVSLLSRETIVYGIAYMHLAKIILGGIFFFLYLKTLTTSGFASLVGAILFSFSGYMILGGCWIGYSTDAVYGAFLLYSFEKWLKQKVCYFFPIAIALISAFSPVWLYLYTIFFLIYAVVRYLEENKWQIRNLSIFLLKMAGIALVGVVMSSILLIPTILNYLQAPRGSGDVSYAGALSSSPIFGLAPPVQNMTLLLRFFSSDMLGTGSNFKGWYNFLEAPMVYCGLVTLLLAPQIFPYLNQRRRRVYAIAAAVWTLPLVFPYFRYAFWAFLGDYYRTLGFFIVLFLFFFSLQALTYIERLSRLNSKTLIATLSVLLILLFYPYVGSTNAIDRDLRSIASVFLIVYTGLLYLMCTERFRELGKVGFILALCIEVAYFSSITVNRRDVVTTEELHQRIGYNDYTVDAVAYLNSIDQSFFRVDKEYYSGLAIHGSLNDAMVFRYRGTPSYSSANQLYYIRFLQELNVIKKGDEPSTRWAPGLMSRPLLQTMASVKYAFTKSNDSHLVRVGYDSITTFGDVRVFRNKYYLPLGFTYDTYMLSSDFSKSSNLQKEIALLRSVVIDEAEKEMLSGLQALHADNSTADLTFEQYGEYRNALREDTLSISEHGQNVIRGRIKLEKEKLLFFSVPYDKGWGAKVDGSEARLMRVNIGFLGLLLEQGEHRIELEFRPRFATAGIVLSGAAFSVYGFLLWRLRRKTPPTAG